jgi:hypothetical protein
MKFDPIGYFSTKYDSSRKFHLIQLFSNIDQFLEDYFSRSDIKFKVWRANQNYPLTLFSIRGVFANNYYKQK